VASLFAVARLGRFLPKLRAALRCGPFFCLGLRLASPCLRMATNRETHGSCNRQNDEPGPRHQIRHCLEHSRSQPNRQLLHPRPSRPDHFGRSFFGCEEIHRGAKNLLRSLRRPPLRTLRFRSQATSPPSSGTSSPPALRARRSRLRAVTSLPSEATWPSRRTRSTSSATEPEAIAEQRCSQSQHLQSEIAGRSIKLLLDCVSEPLQQAGRSSKGC
jgi:hypothetical protein